MSIQVSTRVDEVTKQKFDRICLGIGISPSSALSIFIQSVINHNGIPFSLTSPQSLQDNRMARREMLGCMRGMFSISKDFDEPIDDFREYMK